jgi:hypothetical protein
MSPLNIEVEWSFKHFQFCNSKNYDNIQSINQTNKWKACIYIIKKIIGIFFPNKKLIEENTVMNI